MYLYFVVIYHTNYFGVIHFISALSEKGYKTKFDHIHGNIQTDQLSQLSFRNLKLVKLTTTKNSAKNYHLLLINKQQH